MLFRNSSQNVQVLVCKSASFTLPLFREHDSRYTFHESFKTLLSVMVFQSLIKSLKITQVLFSRRGRERRRKEKKNSSLPREYRIVGFYSILGSHQRKAEARGEYWVPREDLTRMDRASIHHCSFMYLMQSASTCRIFCAKCQYVSSYISITKAWEQ